MPVLVGSIACVSLLPYSMRVHVRKCMLQCARAHPFAHVRNGQTRAHFGQRTCTQTPMIGVHPWDEKAGMSPRHPPMIPDAGSHHGVSCLPYPLATPAINVGPNEQKSDLRAGRGATATDCALLNIAGRGDGVGAWGSRFFLPSMDPILESSPHRPRRLRAPVRANMPHTKTHLHTHHTLSLSLSRQSHQGIARRTQDHHMHHA